MNYDAPAQALANSENADRHPHATRRLIDTHEAMRQTGMGRTFVLTEKSFPKPVKVGRSTRFVESEVQAWIESRISARG
jgi:prophage regulatory protein